MTRLKPTPLLISRSTRALCGAVLALALLAWALRGVSLILLWDVVQGVRFEWLCVSLITFLVSFSVRAWRWGTLLGAHCDPGPFGMRHSAVFIGFGANCVFPANAGEFVRAVVLHRFGKVPFGAALGSILAERLLDAIAVFLFLLAPLFPGAATQSSLVSLGAPYLSGIGAVLILACGVFYVMACWPERIARLAGGVSRVVGLKRFTPQIVARVGSVLNGLDALRYPRRGIIAVAETLLMWGLIAITYWAGMLAFGITSPGVSGAMFVGAFAALGVMIPSSPGHFGPFEAALRFALGAYAIPPDTIVAYTLTLHFQMYASLTTIGLVLAARLGLSWSDLNPWTVAPPSSCGVDAAVTQQHT